MSNPFESFIPQALEARLQDGLAHAMSLGAEGAEAFISVSHSRKAKVQNGALQDLTVSKRGGLGVRVLRGGAKGLRAGLATTTDLAAVDFRGLFAQAWELSALGDEDPWLRQADPSGSDDLPSRFDASVVPKTIPQSGGRVSLVFEIKEGAKTRYLLSRPSNFSVKEICKSNQEKTGPSDDAPS